MTRQWQYKVAFWEPRQGIVNPGDLEQELNKLGEQGWELASALEHETGESISDLTFLLKKPRE